MSLSLSLLSLLLWSFWCRCCRCHCYHCCCGRSDAVVVVIIVVVVVLMPLLSSIIVVVVVLMSSLLLLSLLLPLSSSSLSLMLCALSQQARFSLKSSPRPPGLRTLSSGDLFARLEVASSSLRMYLLNWPSKVSEPACNQRLQMAAYDSFPFPLLAWFALVQNYTFAKCRGQVLSNRWRNGDLICYSSRRDFDVALGSLYLPTDPGTGLLNIFRSFKPFTPKIKK